MIRIHYARCGECQYPGWHLSKWHSWADDYEAEDMISRGHSDPRSQQCGCWCQRPKRHLIHKGRKP